MSANEMNQKLCDYAAKMGFVPAKGVLQPDYFARGTVTINQRKFCTLIMNKIKPKNVVEKLKMGLYVAHLLKSKELRNSYKTSILLYSIVYSYPKLEVWKKMNLTRKEIEAKKNISENVQQKIAENLAELHSEAKNLCSSEVKLEMKNKQLMRVQIFDRILQARLRKYNLLLDQILNLDFFNSKTGDIDVKNSKLKNMLEHVGEEDFDGIELVSVCNECLESIRILIENLEALQNEESKYHSKKIRSPRAPTEEGLETIFDLESKVCRNSLQIIKNKLILKTLKCSNTAGEKNKCEWSAEFDSFEEYNFPRAEYSDPMDEIKLSLRKEILESELAEMKKFVNDNKTVIPELNSIKCQFGESLNVYTDLYSKLKLLTDKATQLIEIRNKVLEECRMLQNECAVEKSQLTYTGVNHFNKFFHKFTEFKDIEEENNDEVDMDNCLKHHDYDWYQLFDNLQINPYTSPVKLLEHITNNQTYLTDVNVVLSSMNEDSCRKEQELKLLDKQRTDFSSRLTKEKQKENELNEEYKHLREAGCKIEKKAADAKNLMTNWFEQPYRKMVSSDEINDNFTLSEWECELRNKLERS